MTGTIRLVWAREEIPDGPSVFLAGPTPRAAEVASWRPQAVDLIAARWTGPKPLTVLLPEDRDGFRAVDYDHQFAWETAGRAAATAILFWIPRDLRTLPGFTTNVEFGHDVTTGRTVLGCPPDCPDPGRNRYLVHLARHYGAPVRETLPETVAAALALVTGAAAAGRPGDERRQGPVLKARGAPTPLT
ncbi:nucleoside 2-deoxyribosyltransferase domain-containing protein [Kitasatospora sp. DSM 101779]|uniref:nucleoside 2-deoxyribosyltransferase domain-containing protein n=1 Tax=Kitasatospora sp. DSM 101779 TaxID=2853165 RepID=UPI0021D7EA00|nr:nucleoside 2-deoxyribosyltransferase domain-containing protein [Kitasatospora sp. DSM 101779]MCU7820557.1 nucleoside 2-deoxyribosyltransferase domain-containing protein [Kitasatospora sp. DSM 101779]